MKTDGGKATYLMINPSPSSLTWRSCFTHLVHYEVFQIFYNSNKTEKFNKIFETSTESVSPSHGPFEAADLYVLKSLLTVLDSKSVSHTVQIQSRHPAKYARQPDVFSLLPFCHTSVETTCNLMQPVSPHAKRKRVRRNCEVSFIVVNLMAPEASIGTRLSD